MIITRDYSRIYTEISINPDSKFLLVGNNIDGWVNIKTIFFNNLIHLKTELESILKNIDAAGEWDLTLYEIPEIYTLLKRWNYYIYPEPAKEIFSYTYMDSFLRKIHWAASHIILFTEDAFYNFETDFAGNKITETLDLYLTYKIYKINWISQ